MDSNSGAHAGGDERLCPDRAPGASRRIRHAVCTDREIQRSRCWFHALRQHIERVHLRLEIGWTWVARQWQRTAINTEAKYLLLRHAFETLKCMRVELKTDSLNDRSRAAILRIGAREEGIFRNHMITASGRIRHTVYFSIVDSEWPEVKARLEARLR